MSYMKMVSEKRALSPPDGRTECVPFSRKGPLAYKRPQKSRCVALKRSARHAPRRHFLACPAGASALLNYFPSNSVARFLMIPLLNARNLGARARAGVLFLRDTGSYGPHILHVLVHVVHVHVT